jgi:hypothetical protein
VGRSGSRLCAVWSLLPTPRALRPSKVSSRRALSRTTTAAGAFAAKQGLTPVPVEASLSISAEVSQSVFAASTCNDVRGGKHDTAQVAP